VAALRILAPAPAAQPSTTAGTVKPAPENGTIPPPVTIETASPVDVQPPVTPSKPTQQLSPAREQARSSQQTLLQDPIVPSALPPQPVAPSTPPANVGSGRPGRPQAAQPMSLADATVPPSTVPSPSVSSVEGGPEPTLAASPRALATSSPEPLPAAHEVMDRTSETSSLPVVQHEIPAVTSAPKTPLLPEAENFAFAVRMVGLESSSMPAPGTQSTVALTTKESPAPTNETSITPTKGSVMQPQSSESREPVQPDIQASSAQRPEASSSAPETEESRAIALKEPDVLKAQPTPGPTPLWNDAAVLQALDAGRVDASAEPLGAERATPSLLVQETHLPVPELPRASASSEILLHLTGNDQSSAAIRVTDRAGSVNVSVHASDAVLRESLRSNLGELSTQLNTQGWKVEGIKSAAVAAHSESHQDSHAEGQRGSQHQQPSGGERQAQRDRRGNSGQWQQDLMQQITGGDAPSGGNG